MGSSGRSIGRIFGAIGCFLCIGLLISLALESSTSGTKPSPTSMSFERSGINAKVKLKPLYANKRRVPNGPDPIHNRREGKSGRPAGRA